MVDRIVVVSPNRFTRRQVSRALVSAGAALELTDQPPAPALRPDLCILDLDATAAEVTARSLSWANDAQVPVILLSLGSDQSKLLELLKSGELGHLVAKHGAIRAMQPMVDERELLVTSQKVLRRDIFGIDKYVGGWGVALREATVRKTSDKEQVIGAFEGFLRELDCPRPVVPELLTVAEELILNAVVHAPCHPDGRRKYEELGPREEILLEPSEFVQVTWACDGQRLMFSVQDHFGRLEKATLLNYLSKAVGGAPVAIEQKTSGAGLGLSMALQRIHQLVINVHERVRTEVIAGWYLRVNTAADFKQVSRSLNLFWLSEAAQAPAIGDDREPRPADVG